MYLRQLTGAQIHIDVDGMVTWDTACFCYAFTWSHHLELIMLPVSHSAATLDS